MIQLHVADRVGPLAARLAEMLHVPPADPMTPDWIAVPSEGMRRWLALSLARHLGAGGPQAGDGVAANITFTFPGSLRLLILDADRAPDEPDPWRVERLAWALLETLDGSVEDPMLRPLQRSGRGGSRYGKARRVADLFDRYHLHRADMVRAWAAGRDLDGAGRRVPDHQAWQPHLWRLVRSHLDTPSPPERMPELLDRLRCGSLHVELPGRLALFGLTLLPGGGGFLELADALGEGREVHLLLLEPSPTASTRLRAAGLLGSAAVPGGPGLPSGVASGGPVRAARPRADDRITAVVANPLLRSWGRLASETALLLAGRDVAVVGAGASDAAAGSDPGPSTTVLGRLQSDLRHDRAPAGALHPAPDDRSVQFHACHGPTRQIEVLRDAILHCLAEDSTLREDDVLVLCPLLERFAPLVEAVFGPSADGAGAERASRPGQGHAPALRYRIADRSVDRANPVVAATEALLDLVSNRFTAGAVLDFVALRPVRERYGFTDDDLAQINEWVAETNVRWGLDAEHRAPFGVPATVTTNTWRAATDRLLAGAAIVAEQADPAIGGVAPLGVEGDEAVLAGRFAELLWRLGELADRCTAVGPIAEWGVLLREAVAALMATPVGAEWQLEVIHRHLAELMEVSGGSARPSHTLLELADVRRALTDRLRSAPGRPDFFRGGVTVSSMSPLRSIPHRVICLLGADQAAFAAGGADGDDLAASSPLPGDRDPRGESRESLLEAVLAAGDRLIVVRDGHDVRTNQPVPPAVVVAELRDAVMASVHADDRAAYAARSEIARPRQAFDERCYVSGALLAGSPWGFEPMALDGAVARRRQHEGHDGPFLQAPLAPDGSRLIELETLHRFLKHPTRSFLERRLRLRLPARDERLSALLPVHLAGLPRWQVGTRLLEAVLRGTPVEEWVRSEQRLGTLPPGVLGRAAVGDLMTTVERLVEAADRLGVEHGPATALPVDVELGDGTRIVGSVSGRLGADRPGPARVQFSRDKPEHRVAAWLDLMALVAQDPATDWRSVTVGRGGMPSAPAAFAELVPRAPLPDVVARRRAALRALEVAVDCFRRGSSEPIPLFPKVSQSLHLGQAKPIDWADPYMGFGDRDDVSTDLVYGSYELEDLRAVPAVAGDPAGSGGRAERFAHYLWGAIDESIADRGHDTQESEA